MAAVLFRLLLSTTAIHAARPPQSIEGLDRLIAATRFWAIQLSMVATERPRRLDFIAGEEEAVWTEKWGWAVQRLWVRCCSVSPVTSPCRLFMAVVWLNARTDAHPFLCCPVPIQGGATLRRCARFGFPVQFERARKYVPRPQISEQILQYWGTPKSS
jgi:hypothetical protein